jgi:hypothetical protein
MLDTRITDFVLARVNNAPKPQTARSGNRRLRAVAASRYGALSPLFCVALYQGARRTAWLA